MEVEKQVLEILGHQFPNSEINFSGDGRHFKLAIVSEKFHGVSRLDRSRMVHEKLNELIQNDTLHALSMKLNTPNEINNGS
jgi:acid stress-induced BolA-like protein IbaG/YrbA